MVSSTAACDRNNRGAERIAEDSETIQATSSNLTFEDITLRQSDDDGNQVWAIDAERAEYSPDQKIATVQAPKGDLFQDGAAIYNVEAQTGEVHQDGEVIFMRGDVTATDIRDGAVLKGQELEWRPKEARIVMRGGLQGTHPKMNATAQEAVVFTRDRRMEITGQVAATTEDPNLRLQGEKIVWYLEEERVESPVPVTIERYEGTQIIDRATGNKGEVMLADNTVNLTDNAALQLREPPVQVTSNSLLWNLEANTVQSDQPVQIVHPTEGVTLTANQGRMDLNQEVVYLNQNVQVVGQRNSARLTSDQLTWQVPTQQVEAVGNVRYSQLNPTMTLQGERADGRLENQTVVVSGGRVVTEIIPE